MKIGAIILLIVIYSCESNSPIKNEFQKIVLIDTPEKVLKDDSEWLTGKTTYYPLYIGNIKDSIIINRDDPDSYLIYENQYKEPDSSQISIYVDASRKIYSISPIPPPPPKGSDYNTYKPARYGALGYPVFIRNLSSDTLSIGYDEFISLIMEAKNEAGKWKEIEIPFLLACGTGIRDIFLPSHGVAITSTEITEGNFKTKLRLRFTSNPIYSNEFDGYIDESLLTKFEH